MTRRALGVVVLCVTTAVVACKKDGGDAPPALIPAKGVVTRGGAPLGPYATVAFELEDDQEKSVTALTDANGNFVLATSYNRTGERKPGAPEGMYTVKIMAPMDEKQGGGENYTLPQKYEVKAGSPNEYKFELPKK